MGVCMSARQQKGMSWLMPEMFQDGAFTYSTSRSQGSRGNFQYLTECTDGVSSHLGCLIRTRVRHNDNPQRVPPAGIAVSGEDTADTLGYRRSVIARWNHNTNRLHPRSEPNRFVVRAGVGVTTRRRISYVCDMSNTPGGMAELTPSESPSAHEIVVKDQREAIKNVLHAQRVKCSNFRFGTRDAVVRHRKTRLANW
jgi:hypothetical protein